MPAHSEEPSSPDRRDHWKLKTRELTIGPVPLLMGIVNATPDSFSDGGRYLDSGRAIDHALELAESGASIVDIGGESTRPYSQSVDVATEIKRVIPVVAAVAKQSDVAISIDTSKAAVAQAAIDAGAEIINDVTGLAGDPKMIEVAASMEVGVCAMHMQGTPQTMQDAPHYKDVVGDVFAYLGQRKEHLLRAGIHPDRICLDPGIGFGKTQQDNVELLTRSERFLELECPILIGHSRKGFIGQLLGDPAADRDIGTLAVSLLLAQKQIQVLRLHEVRPTAEALKVWSALS